MMSENNKELTIERLDKLIDTELPSNNYINKWQKKLKKKIIQEPEYRDLA